jgi:hypothetical protein
VVRLLLCFSLHDASRVEKGGRMQVWSSLPWEIGDLSGSSSSSRSTALCSAVLEDAQTAREFDMEPHGAIEMLRAVTLGPCHVPATRAPLSRELTSLIY